EEHVARLELPDRIHFLGQMSHDELLRGMAEGNWDIVVLPSIVTDSGEHEGTPVSLMEAMICGIPVISTETGGIAELLEGGAGILVNQKDAVALAQAIQRLVSDPALRTKLGKAGQQRVLESFTIQQTVDELERRFMASLH